VTQEISPPSLPLLNNTVGDNACAPSIFPVHCCHKKIWFPDNPYHPAFLVYVPDQNQYNQLIVFGSGTVFFETIVGATADLTVEGMKLHELNVITVDIK